MTVFKRITTLSNRLLKDASGIKRKKVFKLRQKPQGFFYPFSARKKGRLPLLIAFGELRTKYFHPASRNSSFTIYLIKLRS